MSEIMRPIPFGEIVARIQSEYKQSESVFGIRKNKFYHYNADSGFNIYGSRCESPLGPAAGPHTQLAPNILAAYLAGARYMELKTVQIMDGEELRKCVARPCINAEDECYNVEWSTELTVQEAFDEYVKAWFLVHLSAREFLGEKPKQNAGVIFNMSVGYSLDGIKSPKIDAFIEGMKNAKNTPIWQECYAYLRNHLGEFANFTQADLDAISPAVSNNITLSTLHGCPQEEIEKIAAYLLREKKLHTYVKCNPTLLGYADARRIADAMGYTYLSFDDHHFKEDLQFDDAVAMIRRLQKLAAELALQTGVKITNTFPVEIRRGELPGEEMYMSGRALYALSITVAQKLAAAFKGDLNISYSGGADYFNLAAILATGIRPVTIATTVLKPGGYERIPQLADIAVAQKHASPQKIDVAKLTALVVDLGRATATGTAVSDTDRYLKGYRQAQKKAAGTLPLFDCAIAPCRGDSSRCEFVGANIAGCPIHQDIPGYLEKVVIGDLAGAFAIIARTNTAPAITGSICDHQCQYHCTRNDYEDSLQIRTAKKRASDATQNAFTAKLTAPRLYTDRSVGIVGAGPAGIAAALLLRRAGVPVTVYEKTAKPYGIVTHVIPAFRIADEAIDRDYQMAVKLGVDFKFNSAVADVGALKKAHQFVVIATGAWQEGDVMDGSRDALRFLADSKKSGLKLDLGDIVAVIGGGDVAMDCARAAKRNAGVKKVTIVYRRTREFMPAQSEELRLALEDGVEFAELLAPVDFKSGKLTCEKQRLGDIDASGRRGIVGTGEKVTVNADTVISATGAKVDASLFKANGINLTAKGLPVVNEHGESSVAGVYVAGDCKKGAATVVRAIADSAAVVSDILGKLGVKAETFVNEDCSVDESDLYFKKGALIPAKNDATDAMRCLHCDRVCEICVDVCPNRANMVVVEESGAHQVLHVDRMCNECGNCATFCPQGGKPYREKFTVFANDEDFTHSENPGFVTIDGKMKLRGSDRRCKEFAEFVAAQYGYL